MAKYKLFVGGHCYVTCILLARLENCFPSVHPPHHEVRLVASSTAEGRTCSRTLALICDLPRIRWSLPAARILAGCSGSYGVDAASSALHATLLVAHTGASRLMPRSEGSAFCVAVVYVLVCQLCGFSIPARHPCRQPLASSSLQRLVHSEQMIRLAQHRRGRVTVEEGSKGRVECGGSELRSQREPLLVGGTDSLHTVLRLEHGRALSPGSCGVLLRSLYRVINSHRHIVHSRGLY